MDAAGPDGIVEQFVVASWNPQPRTGHYLAADVRQ
jgi:hypothetical protein